MGVRSAAAAVIVARMAPAPFPILFLAPADPIDAVLVSGLLKRLHDEIEEGHFTVVADAGSAPLFRDLPRLDELIVHRRSGLADGLGLWTRLRRRRWGLALDAAGGRLTRWLSVRQRPPAHLELDVALHKVAAAAGLLRLEDEPPAPFLFTSAQTEQRATDLLGDGGPILAMAPAAPWVGSTWPVERFARSALQLLGDDGPLQGGRAMIVGSPQDWKAAESLRRSLPRDRWIDLTAQTDPLVIHACLARARLCIGGAVLWSHLAAAAGTPTLGLYGPTDESVDGIWGAHARVVRGPRSFQAIRAIDTALDQPVCHMLDLTIETVLQAANDLLDETEPASKGRIHA